MTDAAFPPPAISGDDRPATPLAAFVALVLADDALQARLGEIERPDDYVAAALAIAAAHGIALEAHAVLETLHPDPIGLSAFLPSPVTLDRWPSSGWLPAHAVHTGGAPAFDWAWFGPAPLRAPFYEDEVMRAASRPFSRMFRTRTTLDAVIRDVGTVPPPAGFIHHMSRCGSTLAAQMLAADPRAIVLSEAAPLDAVVRWAMQSRAPLDAQVAALRGIVAALGRDRAGRNRSGERRVFFKLDSWHTMALPLFRAAFPDTPWVFLYRNPVEVLVSQQRQRGIHTVAGLLPVEIIDIPGAEGMAADEYAARVIGRTSQAVLDHWPTGGGMLVDYAALPHAVPDAIAPHFGFVPDAAERAAMLHVATRDAKVPDRAFISDTAAKRRAATPELHAAARLLGGVHARLDALRCARPA